MKRYFVILAILLCASCKQYEVGFLNVEYSGYSVDSMIVRIELDDVKASIHPVWQDMYDSWGYEEYSDIYDFVDYYFQAWGQYYDYPYTTPQGADVARAKYGSPWQSVAIEGVLGTNPICITIDSVKALDINGNDAPQQVSKLLEYLIVYNDGTVMLKLDHEVPAGTYVLSYKFTNEGNTDVLRDCYTIYVIEDKDQPLVMF